MTQSIPEAFEASSFLRMDKKVSSTLRAVALLSGYRVLIGHAFWIKVIQYYGDDSNSFDRYSKTYDYCSLASDLNPQFVPIYTFGAAILAFHVKRIEEATRLLEKGIRSNPENRQLKIFLAAIAFQHLEQYDKIIPFLEAEAGRPDAPPMMVNILANTYEKAGRYPEAIRIWQRLLQNGETDEQRIEAAQKLQQLYSLYKSKSP